MVSEGGSIFALVVSIAAIILSLASFYYTWKVEQFRKWYLCGRSDAEDAEDAEWYEAYLKDGYNWATLLDGAFTHRGLAKKLMNISNTKERYLFIDVNSRERLITSVDNLTFENEAS